MMANDYHLRRSNNQNLSGISEKLILSHLAYLQTEDTPVKLEQRARLEGIIKEYLCLVPNELKYCFSSTAEILHRSAATLPNFSGYRACNAWTAISLYAANLLAQPWRKEYRTLKTYSGYYKHEIEAHLIGAEVMFELMGYKHKALGILILEGPIDPDRVSSVSRDAIHAFVECQILKEIWEGVSKNFTTSWLEVLEFRENHVGTPEQAIRALNYRFHEKLNSHPKLNFHPPNYPLISPVVHNIISPSFQYSLYTPSKSFAIPNYSYPTNMCFLADNYRVAHPEYYSNPKNQFDNTYGYIPNKHLGRMEYHTILPTSTSRVPTDCLIDFDLSHPEKSRNIKINLKNGLDETDLCQRQGNITMDNYRQLESSSNLNTPSPNAETWGYVYDELKYSGYTKDLGNRDDILNLKELSGQASRYKSRQVVSELDEKISKSTKKQLAGRLQHSSETSHNSSYDNHQDYTSNSRKLSHGFHSSSEVESHLDKSKEVQGMSNVNDHQQIKNDGSILKYIEDLRICDNKWTCTWCTFINPSNDSICEMCNKSRHRGDEDVPLVSGGKECPKCTLVNEKDILKCSACDADLKNSPTYV